MKLSTEYYSAIALFVGIILKSFGIEIGESEIIKYIESAVYLIAFGNLIYKRFKKGDISVLGVKK